MLGIYHSHIKRNTVTQQWFFSHKHTIILAVWDWRLHTFTEISRLVWNQSVTFLDSINLSSNQNLKPMDVYLGKFINYHLKHLSKQFATSRGEPKHWANDNLGFFTFPHGILASWRFCLFRHFLINNSY